ncbi:MAG: glycerol-3-phosphate acyltransferase [Acidimicrobiales bacterium]
MRRFVALAFCGAGGYVLGMFPSADIAARLARVKSLRESGTQNPGAANALEVLGKSWALGVAVGDITKGYIAGRLGQKLSGTAGGNLAATAAVVGHCFPACADFRGGKGVATSVGQVIATQPVYVLADAAAAGVATQMVSSPHKARKSTMIAAVVWVGTTSLWYLRGWPNPGGPRIHISHPLAALASSAVIVTRFLQEESP